MKSQIKTRISERLLANPYANSDTTMKKKVIVTGGAGYVGSCLVPKLLDAGYPVVVYDLLIYGDQGLPKHPQLQVIKGDIRDIPRFSDAAHGCESIIHLA